VDVKATPAHCPASLVVVLGAMGAPVITCLYFDCKDLKLDVKFFLARDDKCVSLMANTVASTWLRT